MPRKKATTKKIDVKKALKLVTIPEHYFPRTMKMMEKELLRLVNKIKRELMADLKFHGKIR